MRLQKTVKAKIFALTRIKEFLLREEYDNFQDSLRDYAVLSTLQRNSKLKDSSGKLESKMVESSSRKNT